MNYSGALSGVRVIDITTVFMGPSATQMLGDLGADVIKIEGPGGDPTRMVGPRGDVGLGPLFLGLNRNKRSVVLDLKLAEGRDTLLRLVKDADVLTYNVRPAAMARLGLAYEDVAAVNPQIIYAGMVGFSQRGRYAAEPAFDDLIQSACAIPHAQAAATDGVPRYLPLTIADRSVGLYAFGVICAALYARQQSGRGQRVDIPMFETMVPYVLGDHLYGHTFIPPQGGFGYPRLTSRNRRPYKTRDGFVCCLVYTDRQWRSFLLAIDKVDLIDTDPRFRDIRTRTAHIDELYQLVADELQQRTTAEWTDLLKKADIPLFPVHTFESLLQDPHLSDIGFFEEIEHPVVGRIRQPAVPSEWSGTVPGALRPVPVLGQHSEEVLREAGLSEEEISTLMSSGATAGPGGVPAAATEQ